MQQNARRTPNTTTNARPNEQQVRLNPYSAVDSQMKLSLLSFVAHKPQTARLFLDMVRGVDLSGRDTNALFVTSASTIWFQIRAPQTDINILCCYCAAEAAQPGSAVLQRSCRTCE